MIEISARAAYGRFGIDTSSQVFPSSLVTLIKPVFVPAQIVPRPTVLAEIVSIAPRGNDPGWGVAVSASGVIPFGYVRSGLSFRQWVAPRRPAPTKQKQPPTWRWVFPLGGRGRM